MGLLGKSFSERTDERELLLKVRRVFDGLRIVDFRPELPHRGAFDVELASTAEFVNILLAGIFSGKACFFAKVRNFLQDIVGRRFRHGRSPADDLLLRSCHRILDGMRDRMKKDILGRLLRKICKEIHLHRA